MVLCNVWWSDAKGCNYGDCKNYIMYNDFVKDPLEFEKNNVLYHYPMNKDKLKIGRQKCSQ